MAKHPAEVFGYPIKAVSELPEKGSKRYWCPFAENKCNKQSRLIRYPMGVCSVRYGNSIVALCPRRFLQDNIVFKNIADHYFKTRNDLVVFSEIGLPHTGTFDYVMVKHKPFSSDIEDFIVIEFQTGQTTGTGQLVQGLKDCLKGENVEGKSYGFGLNLADIWKRSFTQILNKGIVMENWGHKIFWVIQEPVYQNFLNRYNLNGMAYHIMMSMQLFLQFMTLKRNLANITCLTQESNLPQLTIYSTHSEIIRIFHQKRHLLIN